MDLAETLAAQLRGTGDECAECIRRNSVPSFVSLRVYHRVKENVVATSWTHGPDPNDVQ